jgi:hypothetical protein
MDWDAFHLRCMRNGYGLGLTLTEIGDMEWPDVQRWLSMLDEFLTKQAEAMGNAKTEETPTL